MALRRWSVARNVKAQDGEGKDIKIAMCFIEHENGHQQRLAIPESLLRFTGDDEIERQVIEAANKGGSQVFLPPGAR